MSYSRNKILVAIAKIMEILEISINFYKSQMNKIYVWVWCYEATTYGI